MGDCKKIGFPPYRSSRIYSHSLVCCFWPFSSNKSGVWRSQPSSKCSKCSKPSTALRQVPPSRTLPPIGLAKSGTRARTRGRATGHGLTSPRSRPTAATRVSTSKSGTWLRASEPPSAPTATPHERHTNATLPQCTVCVPHCHSLCATLWSHHHSTSGSHSLLATRLFPHTHPP
jgi:hypothetical protein